MTSSDRAQLLDMGFPAAKVDRALIATGNGGIQSAMDWLVAHEDDVDVDETGEESAAVAAEEGEIAKGDQTAQSLVCDDCGKMFRNHEAAERHAILKGHANFSESMQAVKPLTAEEKVEKLADLRAQMAERKAILAQKEKEDQKRNEKIRRKAGQDLIEAKERMKELEMKKAMEEKKREKEEERKARQRVKDQIEQDKLDRAAKRAAATSVPTAAPAAPVVASPAVKQEYTTARLQMRLPSGVLTHEFPSTTLLKDVRLWICEQVKVPQVTISTTFPRKTFGPSDDGRTLKDLDLVPSAALAIQM